MNMHLECALRWSDCEWPWQTAATDDDRNKSVLSKLWGILLYTTSKSIDVLQFLCLLWVCWWCTINTAKTQKPQMLTIVCVWICVSLFPSGVFMTTIHHSSSHSPNEHATSWIYTQSLIIPTQIPHLSQPTNSRNAHQMRSLHMMVSLIMDKKHEITIDVELVTSNNM